MKLPSIDDDIDQPTNVDRLVARSRARPLRLSRSILYFIVLRTEMMLFLLTSVMGSLLSEKH